MKLRWGWVHKRYGRQVPVSAVRVTFNVDLRDIEQILCSWLVRDHRWWGSDPMDREANLPALTDSQVCDTVRRELECGGTDLFEHIWSDGCSPREQKIVKTWAHDTVIRVYPKQAEETWS